MWNSSSTMDQLYQKTCTGQPDLDRPCQCHALMVIQQGPPCAHLLVLKRVRLNSL